MTVVDSPSGAAGRTRTFDVVDLPFSAGLLAGLGGPRQLAKEAGVL